MFNIFHIDVTLKLDFYDVLKIEIRWPLLLEILTESKPFFDIAIVALACK